jgi:hypothetical protein
LDCTALMRAVDSPFAPHGPGDQIAPVDRYVAFTAKDRRLASLLMRARRGGLNCPAGKIRNTLYCQEKELTAKLQMETSGIIC